MLKLEFGCGMNPTPGYIHHDRVKHSPHIDLAWDLRRMPWRIHLHRDGQLVAVDPHASGYFDNINGATADAFLDEILALDVFEHVSAEVQPWLDECWRLLKVGGLLNIRLPAWDHELSYRDPTHLRVYHRQTMSYWDPRTELYVKFGSIYFAESNKWWHVEKVFTENKDFRYRLRKQAS